MYVNRCAALAVCLAGAGAAQAANVLVIVADDLGADKVGAYAGDFPDYAPAYLPDTAAVDGLAAAGLRFSEAWATPMCSPTRSTLETGLFPFRTGIGRALGPTDAGLDPGVVDSLGETLASSGYATGFFGKWHLGTADETGATGDPRSSPYYATPHPSRLGWEQFDGTLVGSLDDYSAWQEVRWSSPLGAGRVFDRSLSPTAATVDDALRWIGTQRGDWAAVVSFHAPHASGTTNEWLYEDADPTCYRSPELACLADESCADEDRAVFQALTECLDLGVEALLDGIPAPVLDDTLIVFLGDNGTPAEVMEGGFADASTAGGAVRGKGGVFDGGVRVPLVIADGFTWRTGFGGQIRAPGRVVTAPTLTVDLYATLVQRATGHLPARTDGVSLTDCFTQARGCGERDRLLYAEQFQGFASGNDVAAVGRGSARLTVAYDPAADCLASTYYDVATDPYQLAPLPGGGVVPASLRRAFAELHAGSGSWADQVLTRSGWCPAAIR